LQAKYKPKRLIMKKLTTITAIILIMFLIEGCDKDYRDRYTGDWDFVTEISYMNSRLELLDSETVCYSGKIAPGSSESEIIIQYTENDKVTAWIDSNGSSIWTDGAIKYPNGWFDKKGTMYLSFLVYLQHDGAIGHTIRGTKIKKGGKNE